MIPFRDATGEFLNKPICIRIKPDKPRTIKGKLVKYESPIGQPNRAYFPLGIASALADPTAPLVITEGEKKACKATLEGIPTIGLVGVDCWSKKRDLDPKTKRKIGHRKLLEELEAIHWRRRIVYIIFDSDAVDKPAVQHAAEISLANALFDKGVG